MFSKYAKTFNGIHLSVLDLVPIAEGSEARDALHSSIELAKHNYTAVLNWLNI